MKQKVGVVSSASSSTCDASDSSVLKIDLETSDMARASPATPSDSSNSSSASGSKQILRSPILCRDMREPYGSCYFCIQQALRILRISSLSFHQNCHLSLSSSSSV